MKSLFFTDPHLGKVLQSHTTPASRKRLEQALYLQVSSRLKQSSHKLIPRTPVADHWLDYEGLFCLGDLFDKFSNKEDVLLQGYKILEAVTVCMAGNHDMIADINDTSSLQLLSGLTGGTEDSSAALGYCGWDGEDYFIHFIPHCINQESFDKSLQSVALERNTVNILCLHCNYNSDFATQETSLNLTKEMAKFLLEEKGFDYILIGHEHNAAVHFGGKLIILGNTHPTSFHDISDKFAWIYDSETKSFSKEQIYDANERFWKVSVEDFLAGNFPEKELHWVQIEGTLDSGQSIEFAKKVKRLWQEFPSLFAVRVEAKAKSSEVDGFSAEGFMQVMERIQQEVEGMGDTAVLSLYQEICEEVRLEREKENAAQN